MKCLEFSLNLSFTASGKGSHNYTTPSYMHKKRSISHMHQTWSVDLIALYLALAVTEQMDCMALWSKCLLSHQGVADLVPGHDNLWKLSEECVAPAVRSLRQIISGVSTMSWVTQWICNWESAELSGKVPRLWSRGMTTMVTWKTGYAKRHPGGT